MSVTRHQAVGAYRRWEPPDFDAPPAPPPPPPMPEEQEPPIEAAPAFAFNLPTAEELEQMQEAARQEGYAAGHEEGLVAGREEGYAAGHGEGLEAGRQQGYEAGLADARNEAASLQSLVQSFDQALARIDIEVAEELAQLALAVARQMVRQTLAIHPEAVADTVRAALAQLPQAQARIHLNPADLQLVRQLLGEQLEHGGLRLVEDDSVSRGGCHLHAGGSHLDASIETRWRRIVEHLGHHASPPPLPADDSSLPDEAQP